MNQIQRAKCFKDKLMFVFPFFVCFFCIRKVPFIEAIWLIVLLHNNAFHCCCFVFSVVGHPTSHFPFFHSVSRGRSSLSVHSNGNAAWLLSGLLQVTFSSARGRKMFSISKMLVLVPHTPFILVPDCILSYTVGSKVLSACGKKMKSLCLVMWSCV